MFSLQSYTNATPLTIRWPGWTLAIAAVSLGAGALASISQLPKGDFFCTVPFSI
jgi:hypothetical protein